MWAQSTFKMNDFNIFFSSSQQHSPSKLASNWCQPIKTFFSISLTPWTNKLECLFFKGKKVWQHWQLLPMLWSIFAVIYWCNLKIMPIMAQTTLPKKIYNIDNSWSQCYKTFSSQSKRPKELEPKQVFPLRVGSWPSQQVFDKAGNTKGGSISVPLTSCLTNLD